MLKTKIIEKYYPPKKKKKIDSIKGTITKLKNDENRLLELLLMNTLEQDMLK